MPKISSFISIKHKHNVYRDKDCMKKYCESLREYAMKIINFKTKKMKLLTKEQQESYENANNCCICKEKFENRYLKDKKYCKIRDHCHYKGEYRRAGHNICNLKSKMPITFSVPIEKEVTIIDKDGQKVTKNISYILQFIDSASFMASSSSNLVNNL